MKKIMTTALMLLCGLCLFTACEDDRDSNPTLKQPQQGQLVLNKPALADNGLYDLAFSQNLVFTLASLPDYGFPAYTNYTMQVSVNADMSDYIEVTSSPYARIEVDAPTLAATLTDLEVAAGKAESDFPIDLPLYFRVRANAMQYAGGAIEGTELLSNIVTLSNCHLVYSLPPVTTPEKLFITGSFNGWSWDTSLQMAPCYDGTNVFWHLVWIDDAGIKFNSAKSWDGGEVGFDQLNSITGDLASEIKSGGGNIASTNPSWYLMVITTSVSGRDIVYDAQFNKPEVWLMGPVVGNSNWSSFEEGWTCSVPTTSDGDFVSPPFAAAVPGGEGDGVRAYVSVEGYDWWKTEFMVYDGKIEYRGAGPDQNAEVKDGGFGYRVAGAAGQRLYLNFGTDTGEIK